MIMQFTPSREDGRMKTDFIKSLERSDGNPYKCLNATVHDFIKQRGGNDNADGLQTTHIPALDKIVVPEKDGYYTFQLEDLKERVFIYKKSTEVVAGWILNGINRDWQLITFFDLINCEPTIDAAPTCPLVPSQNNPSIMVPIVMTVAPYTELIMELKKNDLFLRKQAERESYEE